jgi:hypothetical protein
VDLERRRIEAQWYAAAARQQVKARWALRKANRVGRKAVVLGRPTVDATDLEIGDDFKVWSGHRQTLISGWGRIRIGDRVFVNCGTVLLSVPRGEPSATTSRWPTEVYIMDSNSHGVEGRPHVEAPVRIGTARGSAPAR